MAFLAVLLTAAAATAATSAVAVPRSGATAARAKQLTPEQPSCSSFFSVATISDLLGGPSRQYGKVTFSATSDFRGDYWDINAGIRGSQCAYDNLKAQRGYPRADDGNFGEVIVGYGVSLENWRKLIELFKLGDSDIFGTFPSSWSPLHVGRAAQAFLNTIDWATYTKFTPAEAHHEYPAWPIYQYVVTVLTKRHNVLQVGFGSASLAETVTVVDSLLDRDQSFF